MSSRQQLTPFEPQEPRRRSGLPRFALPVAVVAAGAAAVAAVAIAATSSHTTTVLTRGPGAPFGAMGMGSYGGPDPSTAGPGYPMPGTSGPSSSPSMPGMPGMSGSSSSGSGYPPTGASGAGSSPSQMARVLGRQLAGNGQQAISLQRTEALANQHPAGAQVDAATKTVRFTNRTVSFVMVASPPSGDMKFRVAGINNPTIEVPAGAQITMEFINGDHDEAHMWLLQAGSSGPADFGGGSAGGAHITAAAPLGDPTSAGQPAETITFRAPAPGAYHYSCPFPGHATMGMYGRFVVEGA